MNNSKPVHPQPVFQIKITALSDGSVNINGFPNNLKVTLDMMTAGTQAVISHFISKAKEGNLDDNNNIIPSKILTPDKKLVNAQGRTIQ
jgi:hypothetical protein